MNTNQHPPQGGMQYPGQPMGPPREGGYPMAMNPQYMQQVPAAMMQMMGQPMGMGQPNLQMQGAPVQPQGPRAPRISLCVGNLSEQVFDLDLYNFFKKKGFAVQSGKVVFNKKTKQHTQTGFINFFTQEEADRCLREMNNVQMNGRALVLTKPRDKAQALDAEANLIVRNLPKELTQKDLSEMFSEFGAIDSCKLQVDFQGQSKGFGYVQFERKEDAAKALKEMDNKVVGESKKAL